VLYRFDIRINHLEYSPIYISFRMISDSVSRELKVTAIVPCRSGMHVQTVQSSARRFADDVQMYQYISARAGSGAGYRRRDGH